MNWSRTEIAFVACRILALFLLLLLIDTVVERAIQWMFDRPDHFFFTFVITIVVWGLPAVLIWSFADSLSRQIAGPADHDDAPSHSGDTQRVRIPTVTGLLQVGIVLIGVVWTLEGFYHLVYAIGAGTMSLNPLPEFVGQVSGHKKATTIASLATGLVGAVLLFTSKQLAHALMGLNPFSEEHDSDHAETATKTENE